MSERVKFNAEEVRVADTGKARLLKLEDEREIWIPESQLQQYPGGVFSVPEWLATKHDIEGDEE